MKKSDLLREIEELKRRIEALEKPSVVPVEVPTSPSVAPWYPPFIVTC